MQIPQEVEFIIKTLNSNGYEAYIVGGCVRDFILGKKPKDWDITTSALPQETKALFEHTYDTGIEHGTITVVINKQNFEVTTYRIDGDYVDFRHPEGVVFTKHIDEDLSRRDFTMNAIAYHSEKGFVDPFNGQGDISLRLIRGVGDAHKRFNEDALRMLRAVRFSAQLGFDIEEKTMTALVNNAPLIKNISVERIRDEFLKLLASDYVDKINLLVSTGLSKYFMPELELILEKNKNMAEILSSCPKTPVALLSALLSELDYKDSERILKSFKLDNKTIKTALTILKYMPAELEEGHYPTRVMLSKIGEEEFKLLLNIKYIFAKANNDLFLCKTLDNIYDEIDDTIKNGDCISLKTLAINGNDISALGIKNGKDIGNALKLAFDKVLKNPELNNKKALEEIVKELIK